MTPNDLEIPEDPTLARFLFRNPIFWIGVGCGLVASIPLRIFLYAVM